MEAVKVIAEPRRREILRLCWRQERSAGDLAAAFDITFGAVSQHLKVLREANLVTVRRAGTRRFYLANRHRLGPLAAYLEQMWAGQIDSLVALAESAEREESGT
jgi:DNA-binding transcriptional ArsR family regulator